MNADAGRAGLTFVIPVRHPENARDWSFVKTTLSETARSISAQHEKSWHAVVVANEGADLPSLPDKFDVRRVDFPPNPLYERGQADREAFVDAVRLDKGRRILAGMLHAPETDYFMVVDDDDFVSRRLVGFVGQHRGEHGWAIRDSYVWPHDGHIVYADPDFSNFCGTSHIVRADLYELPGRCEDASDFYVKHHLGSHVFIEKYLRSKGSPLAPLPFRGAVYRIGHPSAHSKSSGVLRNYFVRRANVRNPFLLGKALCRLRWLTPSLREEFGLHRRRSRPAVIATAKSQRPVGL